jgi:hypothetical protein
VSIAKDSTKKLLDGWRREVGQYATRDKLNAPNGKVALLSTSENFFQGFDQHFGGYTPNVPHGFTTLRAMPGQERSMLISAGERPYTALSPNQIDNGTTLYSRLTWDPAWSRVHIGMHYAIMGTGAQSFSALGLALDVQAWDNSDRGHFRAELSDSGNDTNVPRWKLKKNDGSDVTVTESIGHTTGENENKGGWNFVRLSVDLDHPNGTHGAGTPDTIGSYLELQCNDVVSTLTGLGAGQGYQSPQVNGLIGDFRGGFNPGVSLYRATRTGHTSQTPMLLVGAFYVIVEEG